MVAVVGAEARRREEVTALLRAEGFGIWGAAANETLEAGSLEPGTVVVLLATGTALERVRAMQALAEAQPEARAIVAMPADAPNAPMRRALRAGAAGIVLDSGARARGSRQPPARWPQAARRAELAARPDRPAGAVLPREADPRPGRPGLHQPPDRRQALPGREHRSVKTHLSSAFGKLDAHSRADATARILDPESGYGVGILSLGNGAPTLGNGAPTPAS